MASWKHHFAESFLLSCVLALALFFLASQSVTNIWTQLAFLAPYLGAALLSDNIHSPNLWLIGLLLVIQFNLIVFLMGWTIGRYRNRSPKT
ncbi:hypothetical protein SAMN05192560_1612 [Methylobacillus rhizosphaerae]|uniref:Uncharacterized protein n=1 Tax=Methylobacillus rhizosphaerae TaxID=551994 RepID=A0A239A0Q8_9PROT|nr:hypothetical protein SAMN05192560_1612 [Methylobacillus rhizosphaerae]